MAYFDTDRTGGTAARITTEFYRLVKSIVLQLGKARIPSGKSPEHALAAQARAEAHRRAVDTLMR